MDILDILDENGSIVGSEERGTIHKKGLLHREIHVWLYTSDGELVFQHRAKDKDTFPDLLDASVGGHVEQGQTYEEAAVMEVKEETGLDIAASDLEKIAETQTKTFDEKTGMTNNARRYVFAVRYDGDVSDLHVEDGKSQGFEKWPIDVLLDASEEDKQKFIPGFFKVEMLNIFRAIKALV